METTELLTGREVREQLRISKSTLKNWIRRGELPMPMRIGPARHIRFCRREIEAYLRQKVHA